MELIFKNKIFSLLILYFLFLLIKKRNYLFTSINNEGDLSIVINLKNLTKDTHLFYYDIMKELNSTRNYYFIKSSEKSLTNNYNDL